jgi:hypothetical protein
VAQGKDDHQGFVHLPYPQNPTSDQARVSGYRLPGIPVTGSLDLKYATRQVIAAFDHYYI